MILASFKEWRGEFRFTCLRALIASRARWGCTFLKAAAGPVSGLVPPVVPVFADLVFLGQWSDECLGR